MPPPTPQCPLEHYCPLNGTKKPPLLEALKIQNKKYQEIIKGGRVLHGPFRGMKYPQLKSHGSVIYPKLLGSYEREISSLVESLCQKSYTSIVDIGSAEGYYAVGFGMRIPSANVYAFDSSELAQALCEEMAKANKVSVTCEGFCDKQTLKNINLGTKALILSDCEGYETSLFDTGMAQHLKAHDLLIESHDCLNIETTQYLQKTFSDTHTITEIESIDDIMKAYRYEYPEIASFTLQEKRGFLREGRKSIMRWLYLEPK